MTQIPTEQTITYHTVTLGALTREGEALAEVQTQNEAGETTSVIYRVPTGLPGERVTIAVEAPPTPQPGRKRRRWKPRPPRVWITEVHQPSPLRVTAPCPVFGTCGGCQLQHLRYESQLEWKREVVLKLLQEVGGFDDPPLLATVPCDVPWHYRNHMRFSVNRTGQPGLTAKGTHRVLPLEECPIAHEQINTAFRIVKQHVNPKPQVLIRCSTTNQQMLMQPAQKPEVKQQLAEAGIELHTETMDEVLGGETFRIRPSSFFQTNTKQAEKMAAMVQQGLLTSALAETTEQAKKLTIVDAYCGVGTFALLLARTVGKVIAIEESASAIKDAQWNVRHVDNVEILKGKVEDLLPELSSQIDGFVIDPPRAGCMPAVLYALLKNPVARIVYVSCDPSTLARDLNILCNQHTIYRLHSVQPLDMFPQTAHIECVAVLERNNL
ncbi:class I SAM-dependent RNA methyltransferase [Tengunoibacter tsumagoiensis]|uniref:23S rRNA (Uracil-5-)-methyltransferase RumA n=1 Tax=Tengunoibacter tsumagoiensis TaxID=2014871 RepID=A0A402A2T9_9CHLR|nr:class I SAM-dependent RNA methyltransferase [Tengunoibacter tsumagoiensis]GCE13366.1 23S rRNA (uracil-5-)-methyltransferase RumA [Tengunoibacter tsumagoiensis]